MTPILHLTISGTPRALVFRDVRSSSDPSALVLVRQAAATDRALVTSKHSLVQVAGHLARVMFGFLLLLLGVALTLTLWFMPVGLPLALVGIALIAAPSDFQPV